LSKKTKNKNSKKANYSMPLHISKGIVASSSSSLTINSDSHDLCLNHNTTPSIQINIKVNPDLLFFWPRYKEILANLNTKCMPLQKSSARTQQMKNISSEPHKIQLNLMHKYIL
jgi:hypothetical protein